jgi:hypothetical protein
MDVHEYIYLPPDSPPPDLHGKPYRAIVIIEASVTKAWRDYISAWLVKSGCLYMMAWGQDCSLWDDSVDCANLAEFEYGYIPDENFAMTTWHEREPLREVFLFCEHAARHPIIDLERIILVHISSIERRVELLSDYQSACHA